VDGRPDSKDSRSDGEQAAASAEQTARLARGALRSEVPADLRDVSFPGAVRGYERRAVDAYVERVNRVIAELEVSSSPQAAVRHALDRVGEQTSGVLQRAREVAEELTATSLAEAEQTIRRANVEAEEAREDAQMHAHKLRGEAKQEADEILAHARLQATERIKAAEQQAHSVQRTAEARLRELESQTATAADARKRLFDDLRRTASELEQFASEASGGPSAERREGQSAEEPTQKMRAPSGPPKGEKGKRGGPRGLAEPAAELDR
jgi:DivIVA domain-containing protein